MSLSRAKTTRVPLTYPVSMRMSPLIAASLRYRSSLANRHSAIPFKRAVQWGIQCCAVSHRD